MSFIEAFVLAPVVFGKIIAVFVGIGDKLLPDIRRIAEYNVETVLIALEDFDEGDVPGERNIYGLR